MTIFLLARYASCNLMNLVVPYCLRKFGPWLTRGKCEIYRILHTNLGSNTCTQICTWTFIAGGTVTASLVDLIRRKNGSFKGFCAFFRRFGGVLKLHITSPHCTTRVRELWPQPSSHHSSPILNLNSHQLSSSYQLNPLFSCQLPEY